MTTKTSTKSLKGEAASDATEPARLAALSDNNDVAVQRAVARNPRTPPAALERLSHSSDKATRETVAGNPNASAAVLTRLGGQFPTQLLDNPALDFMLLENPGLFSEVPEETLAAIAKREDCPPEMLGHLARGGHGKGLLMSLVQNGATPGSAIQMILDTPIPDLAERYEVPEDQLRPVRALAAMHVSVMREPSVDDASGMLWQALVERLGFKPSPDEGQLLHHATVPQEVKDDVIAWSVLCGGAESAVRRLVVPGPVLEAIACSSGRGVINQIRKAPKCPPWLEGVTDAAGARAGVLENEQSSRARLDELLRSRSDALRLVLEAHPLADSLPSTSDILDVLSKSRARWIREFVAAHAGTNEKTLMSLACDDDPDVSEAVAENAASTSDILVRIFKASSEKSNGDHRWSSVEYELARNANLPARFIEALAEKGNPSVADNPNASETALRLLFRTAKASHEALARNPRTPADLLEQLAQSKDEDVLRSLAANSKVPAATLGQLARSEDEGVVDALLGNAATPADALLSIARFKDEDPFSWSDWDRKLVGHSNVSGPVLDALIERGLVDLDNHGARLAKDSRISAVSMEHLAAVDCDEPIRKHLALNPSAPTSLLERLATDDDEDVSRAARRALKRRESSSSK